MLPYTVGKDRGVCQYKKKTKDISTLGLLNLTPVLFAFSTEL